MTASWPDNEAIFHAARDIPDPDRRREYVREACGEDEGRIAHIEALLAAADGTDTLLDCPAADIAVATIDQPTTESPGTVIGPYKLIEPIGEGGMGSVWMAQQTAPVRRLVAVKLIKAGMDSRQVIARFEAERQALALMDHPHIARVLDGGTTSGGRPYFVMDLVKGMPINRYCDEHHPNRAGSRGEVTLSRNDAGLLAESDHGIRTGYWKRSNRPAVESLPSRLRYWWRLPRSPLGRPAWRRGPDTKLRTWHRYRPGMLSQSLITRPAAFFPVLAQACSAEYTLRGPS